MYRNIHTGTGCVSASGANCIKSLNWIEAYQRSVLNTVWKNKTGTKSKLTSVLEKHSRMQNRLSAIDVIRIFIIWIRICNRPFPGCTGQSLNVCLKSVKRQVSTSLPANYSWMDVWARGQSTSWCLVYKDRRKKRVHSSDFTVLKITTFYSGTDDNSSTVKGWNQPSRKKKTNKHPLRLYGINPSTWDD